MISNTFTSFVQSTVNQLECTSDYINNYNLIPGVNNPCDVVHKACVDADGNQADGYMFLELYYCDIKQSSLMLLIFMLVFVFIAFHLLSSTAENYLSPALTNISNKLGLSETLAGVTLVAIGNGAPDVIVAVTASGGGDGDDVSFTIGSLFGAGLFVTTMCLALVLVKSGGSIQPNKQMFLRDMVFYFIGVLFIIVYGLIGSIKWYQAIIFVMIYIVYIGVVIYMEQKEKKKPKQSIARAQSLQDLHQLENENTLEQRLTIGENGKQIDEEESDNNQEGDDEENRNNKVQQIQSEENRRSSEENLGKVQLHHEESEDGLRDLFKNNHYESEDKINNNEKNYDMVHLSKSFKLQKQKTMKENKQQSYSKTRHLIKLKLLKAQTEWSELEFGDKVIYIWEIPANFIRDITIPPSEENWSKWRAMVSVIFGPMFFLISGMIPPDTFDPFASNSWIFFLIFGVIGIIFSLIIWKTSHKNMAPSYVWVFSLMAFIISIAWINMVANYLIDFLSFIQIITQINKVLLGMTFLAYGNSAGDYFTNGQLAAMGYGNMALTACYAGQLFNLLIGFGLTMILQSTSSPLQFDLFGIHSSANTSVKIGNAIGYCIVILALVNVITVIIYSFYSKFTYDAKLGNFLRMFYLFILIGATGMGIASDILKPTFTFSN